MKIIFNVFFAAFIGFLWYHFGGGDKAMALVFFFIVLGVLFMRPISYQNPIEREKYLEQIRKNRERKLEIEKAKLEERKKMREYANAQAQQQRKMGKKL